jgi:hypothetical protein
MFKYSLSASMKTLIDLVAAEALLSYAGLARYTWRF